MPSTCDRMLLTTIHQYVSERTCLRPHHQSTTAVRTCQEPGRLLVVMLLMVVPREVIVVVVINAARIACASTRPASCPSTVGLLTHLILDGRKSLLNMGKSVKMPMMFPAHRMGQAWHVSPGSRTVPSSSPRVLVAGNEADRRLTVKGGPRANSLTSTALLAAARTTAFVTCECHFDVLR